MAGQPQQVGGLDRHSAEPLYAQIARLVGEEIQAGRLPAGAALPSEASLCTRFGVARSVVRQALSVLQSEGLIRKEQGRAAIVAARAELRRMVQRSTGLYEQFASSGMLLRTRILKLEKAVPPPEVAEFFGSQNGWLLERLRRIDDMPIAFVRTWLPRDRVPRLDASQLEDASLHAVMARLYGIRPGRGRNRIRAVAADKELAERLETAVGAPLLMLEGQGMDAQGRPMEFFTTWHRPEQLVFDVEVGAETEQVQVSMTNASVEPPSATPASGPQDAFDTLERLLTTALGVVKQARQG